MARGTRKTLERSGTDRLTSGKLPLATPSTPSPSSLRPCSTSPLVLSERLRFHPRSHVGTPTTVYRRRRPTSNGLLTPSHSSLQAADQDPFFTYPRCLEIRNFDKKEKNSKKYIYIYICVRIQNYRTIIGARNRLFWFVKASSCE